MATSRLDLCGTSCALGLALALAACGGDDDTDTGGEGSTSTASTSATTSATASTSATTTTESTTATTSATSSATEDSGTNGTETTSGAETSAGTSAADTANDTSATTTGGGGIQTCAQGQPMCPDGFSCRLSMCCDGVGFCASDDVPTCGGFVGTPCRNGTVCVTDICVADGDGRCLDPEAADALDAEQPACWNIG